MVLFFLHFRYILPTMVRYLCKNFFNENQYSTGIGRSDMQR
jgi:hypothetical protein